MEGVACLASAQGRLRLRLRCGPAGPGQWLAREQLRAELGRLGLLIEAPALAEVALGARDDLTKQALDLGVGRRLKRNEARWVSERVAVRDEEPVGDEDV